MKIQYDLSDKEEAAAKAFMAEQDAKSIERQRASMSPEDFDRKTAGSKYPYRGAIGGGFSWIITHTSLGASIKIRSNATQEEKDVTDYDTW